MILCSCGFRFKPDWEYTRVVPSDEDDQYFEEYVCWCPICGAEHWNYIEERD